MPRVITRHSKGNSASSVENPLQASLEPKERGRPRLRAKDSWDATLQTTTKRRRGRLRSRSTLMLNVTGFSGTLCRLGKGSSELLVPTGRNDAERSLQLGAAQDGVFRPRRSRGIFCRRNVDDLPWRPLGRLRSVAIAGDFQNLAREFKPAYGARPAQMIDPFQITERLRIDVSPCLGSHLRSGFSDHTAPIGNTYLIVDHPHLVPLPGKAQDAERKILAA